MNGLISAHGSLVEPVMVGKAGWSGSAVVANVMASSPCDHDLRYKAGLEPEVV